MLEVKFAEVRREIGEDIGVRGFGSDGNFNAALGPGASLVPGEDGRPVFEIGSILNSFGVFGTTFRALGIDFEAYLNALENKGFAKTLAEPTLVALSGEKASFLAGGEFPIPVVQSGGGGGAGGGGSNSITVEFKPFGVSLGFTPTVLGDGTINLKVEPEVSSIDPAASIQFGGVSIPGLQTRRASTTLELRDGESFAIAGLLQRDFQTTINQVPLLGGIPILGALFRSTEFQKGETELLIVVTPRLVAPIRPDQVRLPTDRVKDPDVGAAVLLGEAYDPVPAGELAAPPAEGSGDYEF
jgi:pilus assembly protein CpaC